MTLKKPNLKTVWVDYVTNFYAGVTAQFIKTGLAYWLLPVDEKNPSSSHAGASCLPGLNIDYKDKNAFGIEAGFRRMIWKGLNFQIGALAVAAKEQNLQINPAPGNSNSFKIYQS